MVKSLRTRNRFSATSVDQLPHQLVALPDVRPPAAAAGPRHRPHVVLPGLRRQPDGLQRLADDRARLPAAGCATQGARRPDGGARPAPHRDRQGRRPSTTSSGPAPTPSCCWRCCTCCSRRASTTPPAYVDGLDARARGWSPPFTPERAEAAQRRRRPTTIRRLARELAAADGAAALRPGRASRPTAFGSVCQWAINCLNMLTGNLDRAGGVMFTEPGDRRRRAPARSAAATTTSGAAGSAGCRSSAASCRWPRCARRSRRPARARSGRCSPSPATRCSPPPTARGSTRRSTALDFMAAVDIYLNETTRHADVILPPTTALERDHYDLVFHALAVRNTARFTPAVLRQGPTARCTTGRSSASSRCAPPPGCTGKAPLKEAARAAGPGSRPARPG